MQGAWCIGRWIYTPCLLSLGLHVMLLIICLRGVSDGDEHILYLHIIEGEISEEAVQSFMGAQSKISSKRISRVILGETLQHCMNGGDGGE